MANASDLKSADRNILRVRLPYPAPFNMHKTNKLAAEAQRRWRDRKRALGLCIRCGKNPAKKDRSKCNRCLIIAANDQSEYTERLRRIRNSGGKLQFRGLNQ